MSAGGSRRGAIRLAAVGLAGLVLIGLAGCVPPPGEDGRRYLVYFDEFSANITDEAKKVVAEAAQTAHAPGTKGVRIEGRASATGSADANKKLAETRTQVVADELARDGVPPTLVHQVPIGQTGSGDPTVAERRVDIVVER